VYFWATPPVTVGVCADVDDAPHVDDVVPADPHVDDDAGAGAGFDVSSFVPEVASSAGADDGVAAIGPPPGTVPPPGALVGPGEVGAPVDAPAGGAVVRSLRQYRHLIASSWISSAQYGHFFTLPLRRPWSRPAYPPGLGVSPLD
jgi:hypothetical protein